MYLRLLKGKQTLESAFEMRESVIIPSAPVCEISQVNDNGLEEKRRKYN